MANLIYPLAKNAFLKGQIDLVTGSTLKAMLVSTTSGADGTHNYTYSSAHEFLSDIPAGARITSGVALSSKAVSAGAFSCGTITWASVAQIAAQTGQTLLIYNDTGTESTSRLVARHDTLTGMPVTPNGADIAVTWPGAVFTLS